MRLSRRGFLNACAAAGAFALTGCNAGPELHRERWYMFGTLLDVDVIDADKVKVQRALSSLSTDFQSMHRDWHAWKPGRLSQLNTAMARGESAAVGADLITLIEGVQDLYRKSGGAFNPAIGRLVGLWGFHNDTLGGGELPSAGAIERLMADAPNPLDLVIESGQVRSINPLAQLDLGGYAKGYGLELGLRRLEEAGIEHAILNAGGDLVTIGQHGNRPWSIAIRHPQAGVRGPLGWLEANGREAISTSGNYERYRVLDGKRYAHILDPRSGWPVDEVVSATVVHHDAALSDAAATAISVAGPRRWYETATAMGVTQVLVVTRDGRVELTRAMAERVQISAAAARQIVVV